MHTELVTLARDQVPTIAWPAERPKDPSAPAPAINARPNTTLWPCDEEQQHVDGEDAVAGEDERAPPNTSERCPPT